MIATVSPLTGETLATYAEMDEATVERALAAAADAAPSWRRASLDQRAEVLHRAAQLLEDERDAFGRLMTIEMGKTLSSAVAEAAKCALACRYYADGIGRLVAAETLVSSERERGEVRYEPLGAILAVMPWNFPFWQVIRFAAPALAAGNVALLKHASNVPQCALALESLFRRAGAPEGVFQTLLVGSSRVEALIADARVHAVTLTGSEPAGRAVAASAGRHLKKAVLELGGSDPFIVTPSADLARAAAVAVAARTINNGQSCIAAKRFIVVGEAAAEFLPRLVDGMRELAMGDPLDATTQLGPLATRAIRDELDAQVRATVAAGGDLRLGGRAPDGPGNFYPPTVIVEPPPGSPAWGDELFGPVASVFTVPDVDAAIALANATAFGLGASAWTRDPGEEERFARELEAGSVFINAMVASDPRFPFGGVKASGYGRELGPWGLREFVNVKTLRVFS
jgi:succinate-semialdehyde dehydrogenase / glutarate-semialdehyde dehydrogenase